MMPRLPAFVALSLCFSPLPGATADSPQVSFQHEVVPILTKLGCNSGGCHGKAEGQNGFQLSLFGFEPAEDYEHIVLESRGRRVFPASPANSLLLLKATGTLPHGGGKPLLPGSSHYQVLLRWIEQGMPGIVVDEPIVSHIEVSPAEQVMTAGQEQALAVIAHLSDGSERDVTELAQFESNDEALVYVDPSGVVSIAERRGTASVMARFQTHVGVFLVTVPVGATVRELPQPENFIDDLVFARLGELGLPPSPLCDDGTFLRRATLDIAGRLPTLEETTAFLQDSAADKHARLVDRLLDSEDYAYHFANKWAAILRNRRADPKLDPKGTFAFHQWIVASFHENRPYDHFVRDILTASGEEVKVPPVVWYREVNEPVAQAEDVAQMFLGQRIACARCHHHPLEKWSQEDYFGMTAFFERLQIDDPPPPKKEKGAKTDPPKPPMTVHYEPGKDQSIHPRTNLPVLPMGLGGVRIEVTEGDDPRTALVDWMTAPDNPYFAKALVNRYWKHFFSVGLVDPEDDLRLTNPPTNPALLDALARHFQDNGYDLKDLIRTICTSTTYRLSAMPNEFNAEDRQNFSRYLPKRLSAEVLLDAIDTVTGMETHFQDAPKEVDRAVELPDSGFESYFLSLFGRPDHGSACECERSSEASLAQFLHMANSQEILEKVMGERAEQYALGRRSHEEQLRELYLVGLAREPSAQEMEVLVGYLAAKEKDAAAAYEDIVWALINTDEFLFNH